MGDLPGAERLLSILHEHLTRHALSVWNTVAQCLLGQMAAQVGTAVASIALATVFLFVARMPGNLFAGGIHGALRFAALTWMAVAAPFAIEAAIFINLHPWVVVGQVLDWLTTSVLSCAIAAWWMRT